MNKMVNDGRVDFRFIRAASQRQEEDLRVRRGGVKVGGGE